MEKTIFTPHYDLLRKEIARIRRAAGMTQRELAGKLRCPQNTVLRIEQGQRRVDLVELRRICRACGASFEQVVRKLGREWKGLDRARKPKRTATARGRR